MGDIRYSAKHFYNYTYTRACVCVIIFRVWKIVEVIMWMLIVQTAYDTGQVWLVIGWEAAPSTATATVEASASAIKEVEHLLEDSTLSWRRIRTGSLLKIINILDVVVTVAATAPHRPLTERRASTTGDSRRQETLLHTTTSARSVTFNNYNTLVDLHVRLRHKLIIII